MCKPFRGDDRLSRSLAIDFGAFRTRIADAKGTLLANIETIAAIDPRTNKVQAIGESARQAAAETPGKLILVRPYRRGRVEDLELFSSYLEAVVRSIGMKSLSRSRVAIAIPVLSKPLEAETLRRIVADRGAREVVNFPSVVAGCYGVGLDPALPDGLLVFLLGASTAEAAILSMGQVVSCASSEVAGIELSSKLGRMFADEHGLVVPYEVCEEVKSHLVRLSPSTPDRAASVWGRERKTGAAKQVTVEEARVRSLVSKSIEEMAEPVITALAGCPPELVSDVAASGLYAFGGSTHLIGFEAFMEAKVGVQCKIGELPELAIIRGLSHLVSTGLRAVG